MNETTATDRDYWIDRVEVEGKERQDALDRVRSPCVIRMGKAEETIWMETNKIENMKTLNLTLKRVWFDMIASDEKKEEYREIKMYWLQRLFEVRKPLGIYDKLDRMFHFAIGFIGDRAGAVKYLLNEGHIVEKDYDIISANNGYQKDCPNVKWNHKYVRIGTGKPEWGAEPGNQYFVLEIGELIQK